MEVEHFIFLKHKSMTMIEGVVCAYLQIPDPSSHTPLRQHTAPYPSPTPKIAYGYLGGKSGNPAGSL